MPVLPDIHFGLIDDEINWRDPDLEDSSLDDDEELSKTPQDVVDMLGFDPLEEDLEKQGSGVMIGCFLPSDLAKEVAVDRDFGEKSEDLHVTILYLGKDLTGSQIETVKTVTEDCSQRYAALQGTIGGVARFPATPSSDDKDVLVRLVDVPRLELLRERLIQKLRDNDVEPVLNHGYTPHITLAYVDPEFESSLKSLKESPLTVDQLTVAVGRQRSDYSLNGKEILKSLPSSSMVHADKPLGDEEDEEDEEEEELEKREHSKEYLDAMLAKVKDELPEWMYKELVKIARASAGGRAKARRRQESLTDLGQEFGKTNPCHNASDGRFCNTGGGGASGGGTSRGSGFDLEGANSIWQLRLTENEKATVQKYSGEDFSIINNHLRQPGSEDVKGFPLKNRLTGMDGAIAKHTVSDETIVYRGVAESFGDVPLRKVFKDKAYVSTSTDPMQAYEFSSGGSIFRIKLKPGQKAAPVNGSSKFPGEKEMLLPRGSKFKVVGKTQGSLQGLDITFIDVEVQ